MAVDTLIGTSDPRENSQYYFENNLTRRAITETARILFRFITVIDVSGLENLPAEGAVVLAANHLTNFDVFTIQFVLPRLIFFMGKAELFRNPLMDAALRRLGAFPVQRGAHDDWALRHAARLLEKGLMLGMFPEGKRSRGLGLHSAKTGTARLAIEAQAPVVPLAINGTQRVFKRFPRRTRITIRIGQPIYPQPDEMPIELTDRIMYGIAAMLPAKLRGVYASQP